MKTLSDPQAKAEIVARLNRLTPDAARQWGTMTVRQMVCHLSDSYLVPMGVGERDDMSNFFNRTVVKYVALHTSMKWPQGVKTIPQIDQAAGAGTQPTEFEADRARLLLLIERFTAPSRDFTFVDHPIFGALTEWQWMRWAYLHADHHLRQFGM
jgi:hypothetical protein